VTRSASPSSSPTRSPPREVTRAQAFLAREVHVVAREIIGAELTIDGVGGIVVEVEAYTRDDPASHSFGGPTARNASMFGPPGHVYVYRSYGIHWMLNLVCGTHAGAAEAVLVRALEPTRGLEQMRVRRAARSDLLLCSGPGRLGQALGVGPDLDGALVGGPRVELVPSPVPCEVVTAPRIGITRAIEQPWRYLMTGSRYASSPRPWARRRPPRA
jgi:DNA-3-methyladenine glycosylase